MGNVNRGATRCREGMWACALRLLFDLLEYAMCDMVNCLPVMERSNGTSSYSDEMDGLFLLLGVCSL